MPAGTRHSPITIEDSEEEVLLELTGSDNLSPDVSTGQPEIEFQLEDSQDVYKQMGGSAHEGAEESMAISDEEPGFIPLQDDLQLSRTSVKRKRDEASTGPTNAPRPVPTQPILSAPPPYEGKKARKRRRRAERLAREASEAQARLHDSQPPQMLTYPPPPHIPKNQPLRNDLSLGSTSKFQHPLPPHPHHFGNAIQPSVPVRTPQNHARQQIPPFTAFQPTTAPSSSKLGTSSNPALSSASNWVTSMARAAEQSASSLERGEIEHGAAPKNWPPMSPKSAILPPLSFPSTSTSANTIAKNTTIPSPSQPYTSTSTITPTARGIIGRKADEDLANVHGFYHISFTTTNWVKNGLNSPKKVKQHHPRADRTLVMEKLPKPCRSVEFVWNWAKKASALGGGGGGVDPMSVSIDQINAKALIEFVDVAAANRAWGSPRLGGHSNEKKQKKGKGEDGIRVWWYRPHEDDIAVGSPMSVAADEVEVVGADEELEEGEIGSDDIVMVPSKPKSPGMAPSAKQPSSSESVQYQQRQAGQPARKTSPPSPLSVSPAQRNPIPIPLPPFPQERRQTPPLPPAPANQLPSSSFYRPLPNPIPIPSSHRNSSYKESMMSDLLNQVRQANTAQVSQSAPSSSAYGSDTPYQPPPQANSFFYQPPYHLDASLSSTSGSWKEPPHSVNPQTKPAPPTSSYSGPTYKPPSAPIPTSPKGKQPQRPLPPKSSCTVKKKPIPLPSVAAAAVSFSSNGATGGTQTGTNKSGVERPKISGRYRNASWRDEELRLYSQRREAESQADDGLVRPAPTEPAGLAKDPFGGQFPSGSEVGLSQSDSSNSIPGLTASSIPRPVSTTTSNQRQNPLLQAAKSITVQGVVKDNGANMGSGIGGDDGLEDFETGEETESRPQVMQRPQQHPIGKVTIAQPIPVVPPPASSVTDARFNSSLLNPSASLSSSAPPVPTPTIALSSSSLSSFVSPPPSEPRAMRKPSNGTPPTEPAAQRLAQTQSSASQGQQGPSPGSGVTANTGASKDGHAGTAATGYSNRTDELARMREQLLKSKLTRRRRTAENSSADNASVSDSAAVPVASATPRSEIKVVTNNLDNASGQQDLPLHIASTSRISADTSGRPPVPPSSPSYVPLPSSSTSSTSSPDAMVDSPVDRTGRSGGGVNGNTERSASENTGKGGEVGREAIYAALGKEAIPTDVEVDMVLEDEAQLFLMDVLGDADGPVVAASNSKSPLPTSPRTSSVVGGALQSEPTAAAIARPIKQQSTQWHQAKRQAPTSLPPTAPPSPVVAEQEQASKRDMSLRQQTLERRVNESKRLMDELVKAKTSDEKKRILDALRNLTAEAQPSAPSQESNGGNTSGTSSGSNSPPSNSHKNHWQNQQQLVHRGYNKTLVSSTMTRNTSTGTSMATTVAKVGVHVWPTTSETAGVLIISDDEDEEEEDGFNHRRA